MCLAQGDAWGENTGVGYTNAPLVSSATVKEPLLDTSLDLIRQSVNISPSRDGLAEVRAPSLQCPARTPNARLKRYVLLCLTRLG